jgi:hypothetical protein
MGARKDLHVQGISISLMAIELLLYLSPVADWCSVYGVQRGVRAKTGLDHPAGITANSLRTCKWNIPR